jgi:serine/threonine protein kinase
MKPENCLIHDDVAMVADFGFSCKTNGRMMTTQCGTPLYMSPAL